MDLGLSGKTALITGGSKGIGRAVAMALASEGVGVHIAARTGPDLETAADAIRRQFDVPVTTHAHDLSDSTEQQALLAAVGDIDVLVNNAGAIPGGDIESVDEARWREAWDLKVFGYINLTRAFIGAMRGRDKGGVIVNILGVAGEKLDANYVAGSTGNAALMAFTRAVAAKSFSQGVRVVGINPGAVHTDRIEQLFRLRAKTEKGDENRWQDYFAALPLQRAAHAEEVADLAAFLASDRAAYINATIDGGGPQ
jgi:hypothetical protein